MEEEAFLFRGSQNLVMTIQNLFGVMLLEKSAHNVVTQGLPPGKVYTCEGVEKVYTSFT